MNFSFSVVCLQECWLQNDDEDHLSQFEIPGYRLLAQKQQCSKKGGLICYVHEEFTPTDTQKFKPSKNDYGKPKVSVLPGKD